MKSQNIIVDKSLTFSVEVIKLCELPEANKKYVVAKQLLRSGTSIGANVFEAQHAESVADFIHKMKIAIKEANETVYWLLICQLSESYPANNFLKELSEELIRIISKIILFSKSKPGGMMFVFGLYLFSFMRYKIDLIK